jgi:Transposase zinc-binding domain
VQAVGWQPKRAPDGAPVHYERRRPEQTTLYRLVQLQAATFVAQAECAAGTDLPQFVKDEFDAFLECGILTHGFLRLHCGYCGHDKLVAFRCKRRFSAVAPFFAFQHHDFSEGFTGHSASVNWTPSVYPRGSAFAAVQTALRPTPSIGIAEAWLVH